MTNYLIKEETLTNLANSVRENAEATSSMTPGEMTTILNSHNLEMNDIISNQATLINQIFTTLEEKINGNSNEQCILDCTNENTQSIDLVDVNSNVIVTIPPSEINSEGIPIITQIDLTPYVGEYIIVNTSSTFSVINMEDGIEVPVGTQTSAPLAPEPDMRYYYYFVAPNTSNKSYLLNIR